MSEKIFKEGLLEGEKNGLLKGKKATPGEMHEKCYPDNTMAELLDTSFRLVQKWI